MGRIVFLLAFFTMLISTVSYGDSNCGLIQEVIERETQEISITHPADHDELAQLYVSRGESYLLSGQYEKAVEDFRNARLHLGYSRDLNAISIIAFRAAFGEVVSYDNLGMYEYAQEALGQLQALVEHVGCNDCVEHRPCQGMAMPAANKASAHKVEVDDFGARPRGRMVCEKSIAKALWTTNKTGESAGHSPKASPQPYEHLPNKRHFNHIIRSAVNTMGFRDTILTCKYKKDKQPQENQDNYDDILGPNQPPEPGWCEEVVVGTATFMEGIALLSPNWAIKTSLVAVLEAFKQRALKCCQAGGFWKACVAPLARKWKQWETNRAQGIFPNAQNLPLYIN